MTLMWAIAQRLISALFLTGLAETAAIAPHTYLTPTALTNLPPRVSSNSPDHQPVFMIASRTTRTDGFLAKI
ncbi:MAG: hypothetical protein ACPLUL_09840 [Thermanaerothrix sp.]|uniref:hypothetical protein n=1 Tax=Thermanaerothrix sp. TaxID=2972675 RepID=UPI003C7A05A2